MMQNLANGCAAMGPMPGKSDDGSKLPASDWALIKRNGICANPCFHHQKYRAINLIFSKFQIPDPGANDAATPVASGLPRESVCRYVPRMSAADSLSIFSNSDGPDYSIELGMVEKGKQIIAGVDEVGRGPLAGPVIAAAVILDPETIPNGLNDSKKLSQLKREALFEQILQSSQVAWTSLPANVIDQINIREATLLAMTLAVDALPYSCDGVIIDGRDVPCGLAHLGECYVKGDARSVSIAAASIVAKVIRDRMMVEASQNYPPYGFEKHKGYGSKLHSDAILKYGPCPLHRKTFSPIKQLLVDDG